MRILFIVNSIDFFISHRLPLAVSLIKNGVEVHVSSGSIDGAEKLKRYGVSHHYCFISRSGMNIIQEFITFVTLLRLLHYIKPSIVHLITLKPVIYGGLISRILGVPGIVLAISGLGTIFISQNKRSTVIRFLIIHLFAYIRKHPNCKVIYQNADDAQDLSGLQGGDGKSNSIYIKGSGINLEQYCPKPEPVGKIRIIFAARLIKDKGLLEYIKAADILSRKHPENIEFCLAGSVDMRNPTSATESEVEEWRAKGSLVILGQVNDISALFSTSSIVVLPSYREGFPRVLMEAAACGRPVVTTDVPGCRDAVQPGRTGLIVPARDAVALADAIDYLIVNPDLRRQMGVAGRLLAEQEFAIESVVEAHWQIYRTLGLQELRQKTINR